jgi:hypothetical protein
MARDDKNDPWRRFRDRQLNQGVSLTRQRAAAQGNIDVQSDTITTADLERMIGDAESLMDQLNAIYNQFLSGSEQRPPIEKRKNLERQIDLIAGAPKAQSQIRFKCNNTVSRFHTLTERWDKQMRALESGAIVRRTNQEGGPKKRSGGGGAL